MTQASLDAAMVQELHDADVAFRAAVQKALADFDAAPPAGWEQWEEWRRPDAWRTIVLPHLDKYVQDSADALRELKAGNPGKAFATATGQMGLSKKVDFDLEWATPANREAIDAALDRTDTAADSIWRVQQASPGTP